MIQIKWKWMIQVSGVFLLLLALRKGSLGLLEVFFKETLNDSLAGVDEPVVNLINSEFGLASHLLLLNLGRVGIVEVFKQPLLHYACRLKGNFAIFSLLSVLLFYLLLFLQLFLRLAQSADQVA
jgi:hypothetical protein